MWLTRGMAWPTLHRIYVEFIKEKDYMQTPFKKNL